MRNLLRRLVPGAGIEPALAVWTLLCGMPVQTGGAIVAAVLVVPAGASAQVAEPKAGTPWWATTLAVAGPLADGLSTVYAINQSGPNAQIVEGNAFFHKLFGSDVKPAEIMAFKVGQAALFGAIVHYAGKENRKAAIGVAIATAVINGYVTAQNIRAAHYARRLNGR